MSIVDDLKLRQEWDRESLKRDRQIPFKAWALREVVFDTADQDTDILNPFPRESPESIRWVPVSLVADNGPVIYRAAPPAWRPWTTERLLLRASVPCTAHLLFFVERPYASPTR